VDAGKGHRERTVVKDTSNFRIGHHRPEQCHTLRKTLPRADLTGLIHASENARLARTLRKRPFTVLPRPETPNQIDTAGSNQGFAIFTPRIFAAIFSLFSTFTRKLSRVFHLVIRRILQLGTRYGGFGLT
jgi:hypothetical protein